MRTDAPTSGKTQKAAESTESEAKKSSAADIKVAKTLSRNKSFFVKDEPHAQKAHRLEGEPSSPELSYLIQQIRLPLFQADNLITLIVNERLQIAALTNFSAKASGYHYSELLGKQINALIADTPLVALIDKCMKKSVKSGDKNDDLAPRMLKVTVKKEMSALSVSAYVSALRYHQYALLIIQTVEQESPYVEVYSYEALRNSLCGDVKASDKKEGGKGDEPDGASSDEPLALKINVLAVAQPAGTSLFPSLLAVSSPTLTSISTPRANPGVVEISIASPPISPSPSCAASNV